MVYIGILTGSDEGRGRGEAVRACSDNSLAHRFSARLSHIDMFHRFNNPILPTSDTIGFMGFRKKRN
jgi:acyl-ACP thioesterase